METLKSAQSINQ